MNGGGDSRECRGCGGAIAAPAPAHAGLCVTCDSDLREHYDALAAENEVGEDEWFRAHHEALAIEYEAMAEDERLRKAGCP